MEIKNKIIYILGFIFLLVPVFVFAHTDEPQPKETSFVVFGHVYPDYEALENSIEKVNELSPDFIVLNGDTLPNSHHLEWDFIKKITDKFDAPVYFVPGNHDVEDRATDKDNFIREANGLYQTFQKNNIDFIFLNSSSIISPIATYDITGDQLNFVKEVLQNKKKNIIFVHHCLFYQDDADLCNVRGQLIGGANNWNSIIMPMLQENNMGVFVGDVGSKQPYFAYEENRLNYYGVGFSERKYKFPQHFLYVKASDSGISVNPIAVYEDIAGLNFKEIKNKPPSFRENIPRFSYERLRMIVIVYLKKITALFFVTAVVFFCISVYLFYKLKRPRV